MTKPALDPPRPDRLGTWVTLGLVVVLLLGWLPHYLTWPWWADLDAWATIAQGWDLGFIPYRQVAIFNFPGPIELAWLTGHAVGWGQTRMTYLLDASSLLGFGIVLVIWSRRLFRRSLPGLLGFLAVLHYYLGLDIALVAQRDWHAPMLVIAGTLILQAYPGWLGRALAGLMLGFALAIRPHVILLIPLQLLVILNGTVGRDHPVRERFVHCLEWLAPTVLAVALAFTPLAWQGLLGDFGQNVRKASYGSGYSRTTLASVLTGVGRQIGTGVFDRRFRWSRNYSDAMNSLFFDLILICGVWQAIRANRTDRRVALVWLLGMLIILLYAPLHPKPHAYLNHPRHLMMGVGFSLVAALLLARPVKHRQLRRALILLLILLAVPSPPAYWSPFASARAVFGSDAGLREPVRVPIGAASHFAPGDDRSPYTWENYRATLAYLRRETQSGTLVANLLRNVPFPAINGPVGRASPLPGESGIIWLWSVEPEREAQFAEAVEASPPGTVAVWDSSQPTFDPRLELPNISRVIRRQFLPEARFGAFEIWRKR